MVRTCNSIDFQPGARIAAFSPEPEYEESTCYLTREQAAPEGIGTLMIVPNSVHFNEICLTCKHLFIFLKTLLYKKLKFSEFYIEFSLKF